MTCTRETTATSEVSMDWLTQKMQALESKVSSLPSRFETLEQRTDLLEKIFLFVDIDVLNKAIAATTSHQCGPPVLIPACQAPACNSSSFINTACGLAHPPRLGKPEKAQRPKVALESIASRPTSADFSECYPKFPTPIPSPRAVSSSLHVDPESSSSISQYPQSADGSTSALSPSIDPSEVCVVEENVEYWAQTQGPIPMPTDPATSSGTHKGDGAVVKEVPMTLISATDAGNADMVTELLDGKADPDARSKDGETALHRAAYWAKGDIVDVLLNAKADPCVRDRKGKTPMRKSYDNPNIVSALLRAKADANATDESGRTTLHRSAENGHVDVIDVLIKAGANPNIGNTEAETPMHEAANFGQLSAMEVLLYAKGDINAQDAFGATPLHFAAYGGHAGIAQLLVDSRANVLMANNDGELPLNSAELGRKPEVADILRTYTDESKMDAAFDPIKATKSDGHAKTVHCEQARIV